MDRFVLVEQLSMFRKLDILKRIFSEKRLWCTSI